MGFAVYLAVTDSFSHVLCELALIRGVRTTLTSRLPSNIWRHLEWRILPILDMDQRSVSPHRLVMLYLQPVTSYLKY